MIFGAMLARFGARWHEGDRRRPQADHDHQRREYHKRRMRCVSFHAPPRSGVRGRDHSRWRTHFVHRHEHARCCDPWPRRGCAGRRWSFGRSSSPCHSSATRCSWVPLALSPSSRWRASGFSAMSRGVVTTRPTARCGSRVHGKRLYFLAFGCLHGGKPVVGYRRHLGPALHLPSQPGRSGHHDPFLSRAEVHGSGLHLAGRRQV